MIFLIQKLKLVIGRKRYQFKKPHKIFITHNKPMAKVEIYTWQYCPFCIRAKDLLNKKGIEYKEYAIDGDQQARMEMIKRANGSSWIRKEPGAPIKSDN